MNYVIEGPRVAGSQLTVALEEMGALVGGVQTSSHWTENIICPSDKLQNDWIPDKHVGLYQQTLQTEPDPGNGPPDCWYVPSSACLSVIQSFHIAVFITAVSRSVALLRRYFWWLSLEKNVREYITASSTCAQNKISFLSSGRAEQRCVQLLGGVQTPMTQPGYLLLISLIK